MKLITICSYCKRYFNPKTKKWQAKKPKGVILGIKGNLDDGHCPACHKEALKKI